MEKKTIFIDNIQELNEFKYRGLYNTKGLNIKDIEIDVDKDDDRIIVRVDIEDKEADVGEYYTLEYIVDTSYNSQKKIIKFLNCKLGTNIVLNSKPCKEIRYVGEDGVLLCYFKLETLDNKLPIRNEVVVIDKRLVGILDIKNKYWGMVDEFIKDNIKDTKYEVKVVESEY